VFNNKRSKHNTRTQEEFVLTDIYNHQTELTVSSQHQHKQPSNNQHAIMIMTMKRQRALFSSAAAFCCTVVTLLLLPTVNTKQEAGGYGIDVSAPIQHVVSSNYDWLPHNVHPGEHNPVPVRLQDQPVQPLGDRHVFYLNYLNGCRNHYKEEQGSSSSWCDRFELDRMLMNQRQPQSMKNYTDIGFKKISAPDNVVKLIEAFWKSNHFKGKEEKWHVGNSYVS
jgi:hypothetical protein